MIMTDEFRRLIEKNRHKIQRIARNYTFNGQYDDLAQEIHLQIWRSMASFNGQSSIDTWLYRIAINTAITFQRSEIRERKGKALTEQVKSQAKASDGQSADEILSLFASQLNSVEIAILSMYIEGLSSSQMAEVLGVKANAVKVRVSRIKQKFEQQFI